MTWVGLSIDISIHNIYIFVQAVLPTFLWILGKNNNNYIMIIIIIIMIIILLKITILNLLELVLTFSLKLELPEGLGKIQIFEFYLQNLWLSWYGLRLKNLHFSKIPSNANVTSNKTSLKKTQPLGICVLTNSQVILLIN